MKKSFLLFGISLIVVIIILIFVLCGKSKVANIDVSDTDFEFKLDVCENYFELVECIIDKDPNEKFTKQMRIDLKNEVRQMQEWWKTITEEELAMKCVEELSKFDNDEMKNRLKAF